MCANKKKKHINLWSAVIVYLSHYGRLFCRRQIIFLFVVESETGLIKYDLRDRRAITEFVKKRNQKNLENPIESRTSSFNWNSNENKKEKKKLISFFLPSVTPYKTATIFIKGTALSV